MDERFIQQVKTISREIVANEFPEEEEYFDFLFDLTIQEIEELESEKEAEFLKGMRAVHPESVLGYTPIIIILSVQILNDLTRGIPVTEEMTKKRIADILENDRVKIPSILKYFGKYKEERN